MELLLILILKSTWRRILITLITLGNAMLCIKTKIKKSKIAGIGLLSGCRPTILLPLLQCMIQDSACQHNKDCRYLFYHPVVEALSISPTLPLLLEELVIYILRNLLSKEVAGSVLMILLVLHLHYLRM